MDQAVTGPRGVGFVIYNIDAVGGMERQALRLAERLARKGLRVTIFSAYFPVETPIKAPFREMRGSIEIIRVPLHNLWLTTEAYEQLFEIVIVAACLRRPELEALYGVHFSGAFHAVRAGRALGLPTLCKFACSGPDGDFATLPRRRNAAALAEQLRHLDRYVCITEGVRREAVEVGLDPARAVRIPNGIDVASYSTFIPPARLPELGPPEERSVVLFVGRLDDQKCVDILLRAFAHVRARVPGARLAIAGKGPRQPALAALAHDLGLDGSVAFLGARDDVPALHRAAAVYVLPSRSEGLSNALMEALASGTPVVATDIPGTNEVVRHDVEALLVPVNNVHALAEAIERILADSALAARLSAAGRARAAGEFDLDRVADRYIELLEEVAARPPILDRAALLGRFVGGFGVAAGRSGALSAIAILRRLVTAVVVTAKRGAGIEQDLLPSVSRRFRGERSLSEIVDRSV
jgi:glycosyltransferase involved in cell wall biosynthesis